MSDYLFKFGSGKSRRYRETVSGEFAETVAVTAALSKLSANFTRPSNTTAYADGDAVTNSTSAPAAMTFSNATRDTAGCGIIRSAILIDAALQPTAGVFDLWVFEASPTATNDNSPFAPAAGNYANVAAIISFTTYYDSASTRVYFSSTVDKGFVLASGTSLYGLLVARNAYTPISAEVFTVKLLVTQG